MRSDRGKVAMRWRRRWLLAVLLLVVPLTGCWDRVEVEDQSYIVSLGVDRAGADRLLVTARVALPSRPGSVGGEVAGKSSIMLKAEASTVTQALYILNGGMTRRLDLRHLRVVALGEDLARAGVEPLMIEMLRNPLARGSVILLQVKGRAADAMEVWTPVGEVNPAKADEGIILQTKYLHLGPAVRMHQFLTRMSDLGGDPYLPIAAINPHAQPPGEPPATGTTSALPGELARSGGNPVEVVGTAVFHRDRLKGFLTVDETQMLLALRGEMGKAYMTFPDPDHPEKPVTLRFHQENMPKYRHGFRGGKPYVAEKLVFEGEVLAMPGGTDYTTPGARERLEAAAGRFAEKAIRGLLQKLHAWNADPVGYGQLFRGGFGTWQAWQQYDWLNHVQALQVDVNAKMRIRRYGLYLGPARVIGK